jgi:hypothetical protein
MRSTVSNWYNQFWKPVKFYTNHLIRSVLKKDQDDNPFIIF